MLQQILLLLHVASLQPSGHAGARIAAGVQHVFVAVMLGLVEQGLDAGLGEAPCTSVQWLLLAPDDVARIGIAVKVFAQLRPGERVQLLDARNGRGADLLAGPVLVQRRIHLPAAHDHPLNLLGRSDGLTVLRVLNDPLEVRVARKVLDRGACERVAEERFGEENGKGCGMNQQTQDLFLWGICVRFRNCRFICLRRMWNRFAGVVMHAICMLQSWCWRSSLSGAGNILESSLQSWR